MIDEEYFQPFQQINYPNTFAYTRIIEVKHASGQKHPRTVITREYSCEPDENNNEKYYPVPNEANRELYRKYKAEAQNSNMSFLRTADRISVLQHGSGGSTGFECI